MTLVKIIHPELGPGLVSEVDESSLQQWHQSGWQRLSDATPQQPEAPAPQAAPARPASKE